MAFALAQNIRQNIYIAVCTLLHLHYLHPHTVGHLVTQQLKQLFSDNLRCKKALGIIGYKLRRKKSFSLRQQAYKS